MRGLAQREEQPDLVDRDLQTLAEGGHRLRQQRRTPGGTERQTDVGGADDLAGKRTQGLPELRAEEQAADLSEHAQQGGGLLSSHQLSRYGLTHRLDDLAGN